MNKVYLVVSVITMVVTCYLATSQNETKLPKKIENLPIGIEVRHNLEQVYATFNEDYPTRGGIFKWEYQTSVKATITDLKIIEFGGFILEGGKWIEKNIELRPFNNQEFQDWYKCPSGVLKKGQIYTDTNNWGTSNKIEDIETKTLWYFIGTNSEGEKFVGFSGIKMIGELKNK